MKTLLAVDSSPLATESSVSRQLTAEFVEKWQQANPEDKLAPRQHEILTTSGELIAELNGADEYVFGVAMHNFSIPSVLKLWIDQVVRAGKTFSYEGGVPAGLLHGKSATFVVSSGGVYDQGTPMAAMNFVEPYLRSMFRFIGVT